MDEPPPVSGLALEVSLMIENNPTSVVAAFEMLLEEIEAEIDFVNRKEKGTQLFLGPRQSRNELRPLFRPLGKSTGTTRTIEEVPCIRHLPTGLRSTSKKSLAGRRVLT
jgi:hypothetical protein